MTRLELLGKNYLTLFSTGWYSAQCPAVIACPGDFFRTMRVVKHPGLAVA